MLEKYQHNLAPAAANTKNTKSVCAIDKKELPKPKPEPEPKPKPKPKISEIEIPKPEPKKIGFRKSYSTFSEVATDFQRGLKAIDDKYTSVPKQSVNTLAKKIELIQNYAQELHEGGYLLDIQICRHITKKLVAVGLVNSRLVADCLPAAYKSQLKGQPKDGKYYTKTKTKEQVITPII